MKSITDRQVKSLCHPDDYRNGEDYFKRGLVSQAWQTPAALHALVEGSGNKPYQVNVTLEGDKFVPHCTCPAHRRRPFCKHVAAVLLAWARTPERFVPEAPTAPPVESRTRRAPRPKAAVRQVQMEGLDKVEELLVELVTYGLLTLTEAQVARVNDLAHTAESHKLRRLARLVGRLGTMLETTLKTQNPPAETAYADLLTDAWLTLQATRRALQDPAADSTFLDELIGKTWRESDLERREGAHLLELAYETVRLDTGFIVDTSFLLSLDDGVLYAEKQITPAQLKKQARKPSYDGRLEGSIGLYPGPSPRRIKLLEVVESAPTDADRQQVLAYAERSTANLFRQFQAVTANPLLSPEAYTLFAPTHFLVDGAEVYGLDAGGQAILLADGWRIQSTLIHRPVAALFGRLTLVEGTLRLTPLSLITAPPHIERIRLD